MSVSLFVAVQQATMALRLLTWIAVFRLPRFVLTLSALRLERPLFNHTCAVVWRQIRAFLPLPVSQSLFLWPQSIVLAGARSPLSLPSLLVFLFQFLTAPSSTELSL